MFNHIKAMRQRWQVRREAAEMSDRDLEDIGLSRSQLQHLVTMPADVPQRVAAMGQIFGLDEAKLRADPPSYVWMLERCGACGDRGACGLVLDRGELSRPRDAAFCPNAADFVDLARVA